MRLKEIKDNTVVHCETMEEAENLAKLTLSESRFVRNWRCYHEETGYRIIDGKIVNFSDLVWYKRNGYKIVKFSDLIEDELTAEEILMLEAEFCENVNCCDCLLNKAFLCNTGAMSVDEARKKLEILKNWKTEQEKKEPEVEWAYRVFNMKTKTDEFFNTEEEAIARCEELVKTQKSQSYASYTRACIVKGE